MKAIRDDIAFMRALAEEGRQAPMLGGGVLVAAGIVFGLASVLQWSTMVGVLNVSPWAPLVIWAAASAVFGAVATLILNQSKTKPGYQSSVNRATGSAWSAVGYTIFAIWMALMAMGFRTQNWAVMQVFPIVILALYGAGWGVAATMSRRAWMRLTSLGCFVGAILIGLMTDSPHMLLVYAGCLVLFGVIPGVALMRQEPSDIV
jgi:hypothetical protein